MEFDSLENWDTEAGVGCYEPAAVLNSISNEQQLTATSEPFVKRNANALSFNAIVDILHLRHEIILGEYLGNY